MTPTWQEDLIELDRLKLKATELNAEAKAAARDRDRHQAACIERLEDPDDGNAQSWRSNDGTLFSLNPSQEYATVQDRSEFVAWALENAPDLVDYRERGDKLTSLVRAALDDSEPLPPGVGFYSKQSISVRRSG